MMAFLIAAYNEDEIGGETRTVLRLHPRLAPYKVAVLPLSKKDTLTPAGRGGPAPARSRTGWCDYDETQSIGRRYRRQDEVGTPLCVTVDFDSLEDNAGHRPRPRHHRTGPRADRRARRHGPRQARLLVRAGCGKALNKLGSAADRQAVEKPAPPLPTAVIVDDDAMTRQLDRGMFEKAGYEVLAGVGTAIEALDLVLTYQPDVLLLDLVLPGMSGEDILPSLKPARRTRRS